MLTAAQLIELLKTIPSDAEIRIYDSYWLKSVPIEPRIIKQPWTDNAYTVMEELG